MKQRPLFRAETSPSELLKLLPLIQSLADSERESVGFWREPALREAITRKRLFAIMAESSEGATFAGYLHFSGVFPNAKIQQVATLPTFRKSGAATALMNILVSQLEQLGFMTIKADVAADLAGSLAFYAKNKFEVVRSRPGGQARNRVIQVHARQLDTDNLFSIADRRDQGGIDLGIRRRSAGDDPLYSFDLNIYFDLVREREHSESARQLFGAALGHVIRIVVADEFVTELQRNSAAGKPDPVLQMALRLPRLPAVDQGQLANLTERVHDLVFVEPGLAAASSKQARSDARHLAHAALARASAFITRDGAILNARSVLLGEIGIDVATLDELIALLPEGSELEAASPAHGEGFETSAISSADAKRYLAAASGSQALLAEFGEDHPDTLQVKREAIRQDGEIVAVGILKTPKGMDPVARLLIHVRPEMVESDLFSDFLLETLTRHACAKLATAIELVHLPGQSATNAIAQTRGFLRSMSGTCYVKAALGRPLTMANWPKAVQEIRRRTGLELPETMPVNDGGTQRIAVTTKAGKSFEVSPGKLEDLLSPAIFIWPQRSGVIVPIGKIYADELLGSSKQENFAFLMSRDAAFLSRRSYVNSPRAANMMQPEAPILFYESVRTGGRGAVVAVARITDAVVIKKAEIPTAGMKKLVVDDVKDFSASEDVHLTTFDNLFVLPNPVPLKYLKQIGAMGKANLISGVSLSSEKMTQILTQGWPAPSA